jgi:hypothetical protein
MDAQPEPALPHVTLILALDFPDDRVAELAAQIATLRAATGAFSPVVVTTSAEVAAIAELGCPVEYVMPYGDWVALQDPERWPAYVEERLNAAVRAHRPGNVLIVAGQPAEGIDRNLYGCLLRLSATAPPESPELDAIAARLATIEATLASLAEEPVVAELAAATLEIARVDESVVQLTKKADRLARQVREATAKPPGLRQRLREAATGMGKSTAGKRARGAKKDTGKSS